MGMRLSIRELGRRALGCRWGVLGGRGGRRRRRLVLLVAQRGGRLRVWWAIGGSGADAWVYATPKMDYAQLTNVCIIV